MYHRRNLAQVVGEGLLNLRRLVRGHGMDSMSDFQGNSAGGRLSKSLHFSPQGYCGRLGGGGFRGRERISLAAQLVFIPGVNGDVKHSPTEGDGIGKRPGRILEDSLGKAPQQKHG
jgi:hypothetical protein